MPPYTRITVDTSLHEQITETAEELGITPGALVQEAVVLYLTSTKDQMMERVQERLDALFAKVGASTTYTALPPPEAAKER